jgi:hypothetical protein
VALTVTGQTGACHQSDRCRQACHPSSEQVKDDPLSKNKAQKQPWKIASNGVTNKNKSRICYECRQKGHMGKDCPNGNIPKSNLVHYDFHNLRNDKNGTCAMREISSPQCSMRVIWVPKNLVAYPIGPNKGTKKCLLSLQVERDALSTWLEGLEITFDQLAM